MQYPKKDGMLSENEFIIDNKVYDISTFKKVLLLLLILKLKKNLTNQVHPGGSIINFFAASDATEPFNEFHFRSEKAKKMLASMPSKPAGTRAQSRSALLTDFAKLRSDFEKVPVIIKTRMAYYLVLKMLDLRTRKELKKEINTIEHKLSSDSFHSLLMFDILIILLILEHCFNSVRKEYSIRLHFTFFIEFLSY